MSIPIEEKNRYRKTLVLQNTAILAGQTDSALINCGGMQPRCVYFPSNWTTSIVKFYFSLDQNGSQLFVLKNFDGIVLADFAVPAVPSVCALPLIPYLFDSVAYFKIVSQTPQVQAVSIPISFQPIFQGIHG